jgi:hypothetical protein
VPRPSSPVYAKASTNCPYLTLENPHHHRQRCCIDRLRFTVVWLSTWTGLGSPAKQCSAGFRSAPVQISQLDNHCCDLQIDLRRSPTTASISRTHSQCQRRGFRLAAASLPRNWFLHLETASIFVPTHGLHEPGAKMVEPAGIEPATSSLQS